MRSVQLMSEYFNRVSNKHENKIAIQSETLSIDYEQLSSFVTSLDLSLSSSGCSPGDVVAIISDHSALAVASAFGCTFTGRAYAPLNSMDPDERLKELFEVSRAPCILVPRALLHKAVSIADSSASILCLEEIWESRQSKSDLPAISSDGAAYVLFTSGSSGIPKAVCHSLDSLMRSVDCYVGDTNVDDQSRISLLTPLSFTPSVFCIFGSILNGATLIVRSIDQHGVKDMTQWVRSNAITLLYATPTVFRRWLGGETGRIESQLKMVMLAGEPMLASDVDLFRSRFGSFAALYNGMGTSETSCIARYVVEADDHFEDGRVPIGYAYDDVTVEIQDAQQRLLGPGETGEMVLYGRHFSGGYLNAPEENDNRFSFDESTGIWTFRTGDLAQRLNDGRLVHCGRADGQVKIRGVRVEPDEVSSIVLRLEPVKEAVVLVSKDKSDQTILIAYVVLKEGMSADIAALRALMRTRAPDVLIPSAFVLLDEMPTLSAGKVDRLALQSIDPKEAVSTLSDLAPQDYVDKEVLKAFCKAFENEAFGFSDDFFIEGGDSLRALELAMAIEERLGVSLSASSLVTHPTPNNIAHHIKRRMTSQTTDCIIDFHPDIPKREDMPALYGVPGVGGHGLGFLELATALPSDMRFFGLEIQGFDGNALTFDSVETLASRLAEDIRRHCPKGPIAFIGYSLGGHIAFELARLFQAEGRSVEHLVLIDSYTAAYFEIEQRHNSQKARKLEIQKKGLFKWVTDKLVSRVRSGLEFDKPGVSQSAIDKLGARPKAYRS